MTRSTGGNVIVSGFLLPTVSSLTIDGAAVAADQSFDVSNSATGERFACAPDASPAQLDTAFEAGELRLDAHTDIRVLHRAK